VKKHFRKRKSGSGPRITLFERAGRAAAMAVICALAAASSGACGAPSEESRIRDFIKKTAALVEKGDLDALMDRLADDYTDFEGRDKAATEALVRDYLGRGGIVIHLLGARVEAVEAGGEASLRAEAMLSSGAAEAFRKLVRFAGECYRFDVRLRKGPRGTWLVTRAEWDAVPLTDLLPESLAALKKLFPEF
jgi:ketosteroid isomerase-like protein